MAKKRKRKIPLRKCVVTKELKPKEEMIRIVRTKEGEVFVDPTGKKNGRGAYLSLTLDVIHEAEKTNVLGKEFKTNIPSEIYTQLKELVSEHHEK